MICVSWFILNEQFWILLTLNGWIWQLVELLVPPKYGFSNFSHTSRVRSIRKMRIFLKKFHDLRAIYGICQTLEKVNTKNCFLSKPIDKIKYILNYSIYIFSEISFAYCGCVELYRNFWDVKNYIFVHFVHRLLNKDNVGLAKPNFGQPQHSNTWNSTTDSEVKHLLIVCKKNKKYNK